MYKGFDDQFSRSTAWLPFARRRVRLLPLLLLVLLPVYGFILYSILLPATPLPHGRRSV